MECQCEHVKADVCIECGKDFSPVLTPVEDKEEE